MGRMIIHTVKKYFSGGVPPCGSTLALKIIALAGLLLYSAGHVAFARDYQVNKSVGGYHVMIRLERYPLSMGDNSIEIEILDSAEQHIEDAKVLVNYYMPPMPRMAPMNYKVAANWDKSSYKADLDIIMAGPWYIKIIVTHQNKRFATKFNVDAQ